MEETQEPLITLQLNREPLSAQVAKQIQDVIIEGRLVPGDKLPPERQLAEQLGVSRTVIREATRSLQERGLVRILTGSGTYVTKATTDIVAQNIGLLVQVQKRSYQDLIEVRRMIEAEIAGLAAERATAEDLEELNSIVNEMKQIAPHVQASMEELEKFVQADMLFHQALARTTKNVLLPILLSPVTDLMLEFRRTLSKRPGAAERAVHFHQAILDKISSRDIKGSREIMEEHLHEAEDLALHGQSRVTD